MGNSGQAEFLRKIKKALGRQTPDPVLKADLFAETMSNATQTLLARIKKRSAAERQNLLDILTEAARPINLNVTPCQDVRSVSAALADLVREKVPEWGDQKSVAAWKHPLIESLNLPEVLSEQRVPVFFTDLQKTDSENLRRRIIDSYIGITSADFCLADTATLVMRTRPGQARAVSLVPSIHVAVIELSRVIADLKELYALLKWDPQASKEGLTNCMTLVSGPSKTADIEATMVHGAHGPREVYLFVIKNSLDP
jgi:L-lactate dehydrogenase complex protein LldG